jgi:hypothetical protein
VVASGFAAFEEFAEAAGVQPLDGARGLVGGEAEVQAAVPQIAQHLANSKPRFDGQRRAGAFAPGPQRRFALGRPGQPPEHRAVGVGREDLHRPVGGRLQGRCIHRRTQPAEHFDHTPVDSRFVGDLQVERPADVEQHRLDHSASLKSLRKCHVSGRADTGVPWHDRANT